MRWGGISCSQVEYRSGNMLLSYGLEPMGLAQSSCVRGTSDHEWLECLDLTSFEQTDLLVPALSDAGIPCLLVLQTGGPLFDGGANRSFDRNAVGEGADCALARDDPSVVLASVPERIGSIGPRTGHSGGTG